MRIPERERNPVETLDPTIKGQVYMKASKQKKIAKHTKKEPTIIYWDKTSKKVNKSGTPTTWSHRQLRR